MNVSSPQCPLAHPASTPLAGRASLDTFRGIIFVGGFSYADTLDSAKGWAGTIRFNGKVLEQFQVCSTLRQG